MMVSSTEANAAMRANGKTNTPREDREIAEAEGTAEALMLLLYEELRRLAASYLRREGAGHTLQATALVHEAYLQLAESPPTQALGREHFFALAATVIRRVLIQHARKRRCMKRGGGRRRVALEEVTGALERDDLDLLEVDDALERLRTIDPVKERIVELRFFGGLSVDEVAELLALSPRSVARHWRLARAWLRVELAESC
jgi:RNA polymerase sigma factor (TIGR02999 family)